VVQRREAAQLGQRFSHEFASPPEAPSPEVSRQSSHRVAEQWLRRVDNSATHCNSTFNKNEVANSFKWAVIDNCVARATP